MGKEADYRPRVLPCEWPWAAPGIGSRIDRPHRIGAGLNAYERAGGVIITGPCGLRHELTREEMRQVGQWLVDNGKPEGEAPA